MTMLEQIAKDITDAMKKKEKERLDALRYLKAMLQENKVSKAPKAELDIVVAHHKKLKDSIENFPEGHILREKTLKEISFLEIYLPKQMTKDEVVSLIKSIISSQENTQIGLVMKELSPQIKGKFDGKEASNLVSELLKN